MPEQRMPLLNYILVALMEKLSKSWESLRTELYLDTVFSHLKTTNRHFKQSGTHKKMNGINGNHGKLEYSELASIIHQHCSPTSEYFAKRLKKCKILSPYLCKDVENLDNFGCPKASKLLENDDAEWNCSNYPYQQKKTLHCGEKKTYVYGIWTLNFFANIY